MAKEAEAGEHLGVVLTRAPYRKFYFLLAWLLDRFSHKGMAATVAQLQRLASYGAHSGLSQKSSCRRKTSARINFHKNARLTPRASAHARPGVGFLFS